MIGLCAIDPGGVSGIVLWREMKPGNFLSGQVQIAGPISDHANTLLNMAFDLGCRVLIIESFLPRPGTVYTSQSWTPIRIIQAIETLLWRNDRDDVEVVYQTPAQKEVINDVRLKQWGLYQKGKPHANDAMRHMVLALRTRELKVHRPIEVKQL